MALLRIAVVCLAVFLLPCVHAAEKDASLQIAPPLAGLLNRRVHRDPLEKLKQRGPFLIEGDRVYFLQPDLSLTALELDSGRVLLRNTEIRHIRFSA